MRGDEKNWCLRLELANAGNYFKARNIVQKQIDDTKTEAPLSRLINSLHALCDKHHLVTARLEHKPERVAYGWFVIDDQNTDLIVY